MENKEGKRFISILSDYGFKVTFADENNTYFLRRALKALIQSKEDIKTVQFLRNEFFGNTEDSRGGLYDLLCEDEKGNNFIVEMQLGRYKHYIQRSKFYAFQRFNTFVEKGKYKFDNLPKVYCIGFLAKDIFPALASYYHHGTLKNQYGEELDDQISHIIVEISKFDKEKEDLESDLEKLIFVMKHLDKYQEANQLPEFLAEDWLEKITEKLDKRSMTSEQRMHFEMMLAKTVSMREMMREEAKEEVKQEAKEEVKQEMKEEVKQEMKEEVKQEMKEEVKQEMKEEVKQEVKEEVEQEVEQKTNLKTALNLKKLGVDYNIISQSTGISIDELEKL